MKKQKNNNGVAQDPNFSSEAKKYDKPVASREYLLQILTDHGAPLTLEQVIDFLELWNDEDSMEGVRRRLGAMIRDGQVIRNRRGGYVPLSNTDLIRGKVSAHPDGFGFLIPDEGGDDLYLSGREMRQVLHGDKVVVCQIGLDQRGRKKGKIVDVIERVNKQIVGRFHSEKGIVYVIADNKKIHQEILLRADGTGDAEPGDIVRVEVVEQPNKRHQPVGRVIEVLGAHMMPGMEIEIAMHSHDIPGEWPDDVLEESSAFGVEVSEEDKANRKDVRKLPLVTIDGEDAKDFDDAVYCSKTANGWRLLVAIADVSHYVTPDSALDREALNRATSVYFPGRVIPMLPESLSNGLCSLNPDVDRLCMLCELSINKDGQITRSGFKKAVMRSHARLTYTKVAGMLIDGDEELRSQYSDVVPHLAELHNLFTALLKARKKRGTIDFETVETRIVFDENKKIDAIVPVIRNDAHKLIEECMIQANIAAARFLQRRKIPGLYRVHEGAKPSKLDDLRDFLGQRGLSLGGGEAPEAHDFATLIKQLDGRVDANVVQTVLLRTLMQAQYQPKNDGHFGLALEEYAHFTSPIRRYPDLLVHRAITHSVEGGKSSEYMYSEADMEKLGAHCSTNERRADEAVRDVMDWLKCEYMQDHIGGDYEGSITTVTSFGLFVMLKNIYVEGLVHITSLDKDYYRYDGVSHRLVGERAGKVFQLGDSINVTVASVNLDERKIDFMPVGSERKQDKGAGSRKPKSHKKQKKHVEVETKDSKPKKPRKPRKKKPSSHKKTVGEAATAAGNQTASKKKVTSKKKVVAKKAMSKKKTSSRRRKKPTQVKDQ